MPPLYKASPVQADITATIGAYYIGSIVGCVLWGVNLVQGLKYFRAFPGDPKILKTYVAWTMLVDAIYNISFVGTLWFWTIQNWGNLLTLSAISWGWQGVTISATTLMTTCQLYFAFRVYVISGRENWWIPVLIVLLSLFQLGFGIASVVNAAMLKDASKLGSWRWGVYCWFWGSAGADLLITGGMIWFLAKMRTGYAFSSKIFKDWTLLALETNAICCIGAIATPIIFSRSAGKTLAYDGFDLPIIHIYTLSLLQALLSRKDLREYQARSGNVNVGPYPLTISTGSQKSGTGLRSGTTSGSSGTHSSGSHDKKSSVAQEVHIHTETAMQALQHPHSEKVFYPEHRSQTMADRYPFMEWLQPQDGDQPQPHSQPRTL